MTERPDRMKAEGQRFKIYAITHRDGREMVRWTDTKLKKDHHEPVDRLLERCYRELDGLTEADAEAFMEARERFLEGQEKNQDERSSRRDRGAQSGSCNLLSTPLTGGQQ